jgi:hypothetical protein
MGQFLRRWAAATSRAEPVFCLYPQFPSERSSHMSQSTDAHAEAAYWVIPLDKKAFAVEVITPWNYPTTVSTFASAADAKAWIAAHRRRVLSSVGFARPVTAVPIVAAVPDAARGTNRQRMASDKSGDRVNTGAADEEPRAIAYR